MRQDPKAAGYHYNLSKLKTLLRSIVVDYRHGRKITEADIRDAIQYADEVKAKYGQLPEEVANMVRSLHRLKTYSERGANPYPKPGSISGDWDYGSEQSFVAYQGREDFARAKAAGFPMPASRGSLGITAERPRGSRGTIAEWQKLPSEMEPFPTSALPPRSRSRIVPSNTKPLPPVPKPQLLEPLISPNPNLKPLPKIQPKKKVG